MEVNGTILRWGNSYGVRLSRSQVKKLNLKEKEKVVLKLKREVNPLKDLWDLGGKNKRIISRKEFEDTRKILEWGI